MGWSPRDSHDGPSHAQAAKGNPTQPRNAWGAVGGIPTWRIRIRRFGRRRINENGLSIHPHGSAWNDPQSHVWPSSSRLTNMAHKCSLCDEFAAPRQIRSKRDIDSLHSSLMASIRGGGLEIESGDLQWADVIDCALKCSGCGRHFHLTCETFHGSGGEWRVDPSD